MKVLMMVSWYSEKGKQISGGIFHYELSKELQKSCDIAIYYPYDRTLDTSYSDAMEWGIRTFRSKYKLQDKLKNRWYMYRAMKQIVREFNPDLIHANVATEVGRFAIALGKLFHIPVMITEHSAIEASGVQTFPHKQYANYAYKHSKYNACVSDELTKGLRKLFPKYSFETIYNGIIVPKIMDNMENKYRVEEYCNIVLVAGLYNLEIKGIPTLLEQIKDLVQEGEKIKLHIVGDGEKREQLEQLILKYHLLDSVILHGQQSRENVQEIMNEMDFLMSTSKFESFGCTMAEASMLGKPVLATKSGGSLSIVNKETGRLIKDCTNYSSDIKNMIQDYKTFNTEYIKQLAEKKFGISNIAKRYVDIYQKIIENK